MNSNVKVFLGIVVILVISRIVSPNFNVLFARHLTYVIVCMPIIYGLILIPMNKGKHGLDTFNIFLISSLIVAYFSTKEILSALIICLIVNIVYRLIVKKFSI